ncbi:transcriptional regulator, LacI family [Coriobacterium glomerans PW2]|uniref:Transcriptional regulator, LacI family n=1 Tax=Coriobacterium glomerans (strain ATCC 49209 / DSM 20642 / JCM 10262 / PW2) TaxID=700015 RepID=F2N8L5_CORGP|nr:LacI family DNA-binding transcriptional regulator [Coriobacterium glomerans]AEB07398.1 transcriptional regulator, LacI family [Coriobacterium glomerans PW2]
MAAKVTLKEIAREVGLSPTSVSLVLNNRPNKVSQINRERIRAVARKKHYIPNQIARSLVTQHSNTLGLIVPNIESRFFSSLAKNLEIRCRRRGYALFIMNADDASSNDSELVRLLLNRGVDGLLLVLSDEMSPNERLIEDLSICPVPFVMIDRTIEGLRCDKVRFNSELGGYLATSYLLARGHRRIACLVNTHSNTGRARLAGYARAMAEFGVEVDPSRVLESDYYIADAYRASADLIGTDATGVFASSDNIALGLLKRLHECGRRCPRDISLVSYDNSAADALFEPALTSIEQSVDELSEHALELLFSRIAESAALSEPTPAVERVLPPRLVEKESVRVIERPRS